MLGEVFVGGEDAKLVHHPRHGFVVHESFFLLGLEVTQGEGTEEVTMVVVVVDEEEGQVNVVE